MNYTLERLLEKGYGNRVRVSKEAYPQIKMDALELSERTKEFGRNSRVNVVVIDFSDPHNLYTIDISSRHAALAEYHRKRVLFFHENVDQVLSFSTLCVARAVSSSDSSETERHVFITAFDDLIVGGVENPLVASSYALSFNPRGNDRYLSKTIRDKRVEMLEKTVGQIPQEEKGVVLIVGESGIGKTTLLDDYTFKQPEFVNHTSMEEYANEPVDQVAEHFLRENKDRNLLILDEAGLVKQELHDRLASEYRVLIYASIREPRLEIKGKCVKMHLTGEDLKTNK